MRASLSKSLRLLGALVLGVLPAATAAKELPEVKVLYVGSDRASDFTAFLEGYVAEVAAKSLSEFKPEDAGPFDVVLLDWPQNSEAREMRKFTSPLGAREAWQKPTVLLGSAGLHLAVAWKVKGGSGCTCMDPLAYDLRQHEIFAMPYRIDRGRMISISTPEDFREEIVDEQIRVLPLVDDLRLPRRAGWCTYTTHFDLNPDVEVFSGGVNHKTPTAAGLWRQGNLLHFGFQESPVEMNESGQWLLLNSIAYISRFKQDRPIALTPSVFAGPVALFRTSPAAYLRKTEYPTDFCQDRIAPQLWEQLSSLVDRGQMASRAAELAPLLRPDSQQRLEIDEDLQAFDIPFDEPEFFDKTLAALSSNDQSAAVRARRLLKRYVPDGPEDDDPASWRAWWNENRDYAFGSDHGDYRWYVDPIAKQRGIPQSELRGPRRADPPVAQVTDKK